MVKTIERPVIHKQEKAKPENEKIFQVFICFRKSIGMISEYIDGGTGSCGVYAALAKIFKRSPIEMYEIITRIVWGGGNGLMQEYLSLEDASLVVAQASLFAHTSGCMCFLKQEASFYIEETKR